jgi:hypothetical protein
MHPALAGFLLAWSERSPYAKDNDYVFPSFRLKGKKPLSASIMGRRYLRPTAVKAGAIQEDERGRFGFHNFLYDKFVPMSRLAVPNRFDIRSVLICPERLRGTMA